MSSKPLQVNKIRKNSQSHPCQNYDNEKSLECEKMAQNFVLSIFHSVNNEINNDNNEKEIVSKFISSLFEEVQNEFMISKFVDSVLLNAKTEIQKIKDQFNIVQPKLALQNKNNEVNCATENNSPSKCKRVVFSNEVDSKKKRNYSVNKNDIKNNSKNNWHKTNLSVKYRTNVHNAKEKMKCEEKLKLMQKHLLVMKKLQDEMDKKIYSLKNKEENIKNIKKEKASLKKTLIKMRKNIEKQKEEINNRIKQSSGKAKLEKMKNYKKIKEERKVLNDRMKLIQQKNNSNVKHLIQKIRVLRAFNKNIVPQKKKNIYKNNIEKNMKEFEKNKEMTMLLKKQISKLQNKENEYVDKLNRTKAKLCNYDTEDKSYSNFTCKTYRKAKSHVIDF